MKDGNGGAVAIILTTTVDLKIGPDGSGNSVSFKKCIASNESNGGYGGAIYLKVEGDFESTTKPSINPILKNIAFGTGDSKNSAISGPDIFIYNSYPELISETDFSVLNLWVSTVDGKPQLKPGWSTQAMGLDQSTDTIIPLLTYWYQNFAIIKVDTENGSESKCVAWEIFPAKRSQ